MTADEATWRFVDEHLKDDVRQLALKKSKYNAIDFEFALQQIQGRQKTRDKLPTLCTIPRFGFPPTLALEQCSSEQTAQYKSLVINNMLRRDGACPVSIGNASELCCRDAIHCVSTVNATEMSCTDVPWRVSTVKNGKTFADLTGGFGIDTLFLSNLFETCHYVEPQQTLCDIMAYNSKLMHLDHIQIHQATMENFIQEMDGVEVIYVDPSRRNNQGSRVVGLEDCMPNVLLYKDLLLRKCDLLMLKLSPMLDIKRALIQLPETAEIHVVAVEGECKELLFLLDKSKSEAVRFVAVNLKNGKSEKFCFTAQEETEALPMYAQEVKKYLYEPNAAIMKAGAFKSVALRFGLEKLHSHTHLYTSDTLLDNFPGRCFQVLRLLNVKDAMLLKNEISKANVSVRNFPLSADELRKKLKLADGGDVYLYGTTIAKEQKVVIQCLRIKDTCQTC